MSSNAFPRLEREYNEREEAREMDKYERDEAVRAEKVLQARQRHGKPFAFEPGSNWTPRAVPVLTEWLQSQKREEKK